MGVPDGFRPTGRNRKTFDPKDIKATGARHPGPVPGGW